MPWARFDDRFPSNRKVRKLSDAAFRLYVSAICWSAENLTDGFVADDDLPLVSDVRDPDGACDELVHRGLWEDLPGGWFIHDYFDYNPTAEQVKAERAAKTERQQRWRQNKRNAALGIKPVDASTDASTAPSRDASGDAAPSRPDPSRPVLPTEVTTSSSSATPTDGHTSKPKRPKRSEKPARFDDFWSAYPRKVAKAAAEKAYARALADGVSPDLLVDTAALYAMERKTQDPQYTKHPATWLNARCWEDEPDPAYTAPPVAAPGAHQPWRNPTDNSDYYGDL